MSYMYVCQNIIALFALYVQVRPLSTRTILQHISISIEIISYYLLYNFKTKYVNKACKMPKYGQIMNK